MGSARKDTLRLSAGHSAGEQCCRNTLWLCTAGIFAVGRCKDVLRLGTARLLCAWARQRYSVVEHCREFLRLGSARIFFGSALHGYSAVGLCKDALPMKNSSVLIVSVTMSVL